VFLNADTLPAINVGVNVLAHAGAKIDVVNNSPFTMNVNDAVIRDTKTVQIVNGQYTVLNPGNVYFNSTALTNVGANNSAKEISIVQKKVGVASAYDTGGLPPPSTALDQDLYVVGDVVNETGKVTIKNFEGSITVAGEIRGDPIDIFAQQDFTLNSDDWFHTGKDPRQLINFDTLRAMVFNVPGNYQALPFPDATDVGGIDLQAAI